MCCRYHTDEPNSLLLQSEEDEEDVEPEDLVWPKQELSPGSDSPSVIKEHRFASLKPSSLSIADYVDLCDSVCHLRFISSHRPLRIGYNTFGSTPFPLTSFPSLTTQGFFYCKIYPDQPLATEIRFRLTPRPSPVSFRSGSDLLKSNRLPWSIPLLAMFKDYGAFEPLVQFMTSEKILPERLSLQELDGFGYSHFAAIKEHASVVLRSFGEPFYYSFKLKSPSLLWIVGRDRIRPIFTRDLFDLPHIARVRGHASLPLDVDVTDIELNTMTPRAGECSVVDRRPAQDADASYHR
ncbi:hypothetical protein C8Q80DRAFT_639232 [Daedaleopsis nitida]|nr:hypothetical protein C8Q80DRAFT_639232 [Daedaleopsis nitida]